MLLFIGVAEVDECVALSADGVSTLIAQELTLKKTAFALIAGGMVIVLCNNFL